MQRPHLRLGCEVPQNSLSNPPIPVVLKLSATFVYLSSREEDGMPRQKSLLTIIRDLVQEEVGNAIRSFVGTVSAKKPSKNGRRRRRGTRRTWRPGGPGRPPKAVAERMARKKAARSSSKAKKVRRRERRGARRPAGSKTKAA